MAKANNPVESTNKSLRILEELYELQSAGVTELATHLNMSKGTVHHHLSTLEQREYVVNEEGTYRLGLRLFEMGIQTRRQTRVYNIAKEEIDQLAEQTGEMANLMLEEHGRGIYVYISKGEQAIRLDTKIGTRQYLHTSALGKSILAYMSEQRLDEVIHRHGLPAETPNTVTNREALMRELNEIRDRGVAFDGEERAEGIRCVAAPITNNHDELIGAVSVSGPSSRMKEERFKQEIPEIVKDTATVVGINVSYSQ
jgi:DNA-binding IclR family transcriptional regulator